MNNQTQQTMNDCLSPLHYWLYYETTILEYVFLETGKFQKV